MKWHIPFGFLLVGAFLMYFPELKDRLDYPRFLLTFLYFGFFWMAMATSWNILTGYSGYFSFGHGAFYGAGVYTSAALVTKSGLPFLLTLPLAGLMSAALGVVVGVVVFRLRQLRGEMFGLLTLAVDFVLASVVRNSDFIDGGFGLSLGRVEYPEILGTFPEMIYRVGLGIAFLTIFSAYLVQNSRLGRGLFAIRDDEAVAEGLGVPTFRYKMIAFGLSAFFAGLAGGLHTAQIGYVTVEGTFNLTVPLFVILMSLLGGRQHWLGPALGAIIIHTFNDAFSDTRFQLLNEIIIGVLLIVIILFLPEGIYDRLRKRIVPASILAAIVTVIQMQTIGGRITEQATVVIFVVLGLLMIPEGFYRRSVGRFLFTHDAAGM
ncbi:MAG TPA: branched-chain amino acid ABC transporter permease, partial [Aggregatilineales bacterium]|nr:branched-chain amino acid ABC transporter permease [Aggregatilineales bacterium]